MYRLALARTRNIDNAEDVFQEVFLRLSKKMPEFQSAEHEKAWLIRVTINCSKNMLSSFWNKNIIQLEEEIQFEEEETNEIYFDVLRLPQKERTILHLYYYENLKLKEIAGLMGITEKNAKTKLFRARQKLKEVLEGGEQDEEI